MIASAVRIGETANPTSGGPRALCSAYRAALSCLSTICTTSRVRHMSLVHHLSRVTGLSPRPQVPPPTSRHPSRWSACWHAEPCAIASANAQGYAPRIVRFGSFGSVARRSKGRGDTSYPLNSADATPLFHAWLNLRNGDYRQTGHSISCNSG